DWTEESRYSLSPQSKQILAALDREVKLIAFLPTADPTQDELHRLLDEYAAGSRRFTFDFIDPDRRPGEALRHGMQEYGLLLVATEKKENVRAATEQGITSALIRLLSPRPVQVAFLTGNGEASPFDADPGGLRAAGDALLANGYRLRRLSLFTAEHLDSLDLLVIAGPRSEYRPEETALLDGYLHGAAGLAPWLMSWGVMVGADRIVDGSGRGRLVGLDPETPVVSQYEDNPVTRGFNLGTYYRLARSVRLPTALPKPSRGWLLFRSGTGSWAETDPPGIPARLDPGRDRLGPVPMAVALDHPGQNGARLLVIGDSDFATNRDWRVPGGGDLFLNAVAWLVERPEEIAIRAPVVRERRVELNAEQARTIFVAFVLGIPLAIMVLGVTVAWRRRAL
ncbi:MAG: hypothetical protein FD129_1394, partial [bacterium]